MSMQHYMKDRGFLYRVQTRQDGNTTLRDLVINFPFLGFDDQPLTIKVAPADAWVSGDASIEAKLIIDRIMNKGPLFSYFVDNEKDPLIGPALIGGFVLHIEVDGQHYEKVFRAPEPTQDRIKAQNMAENLAHAYKVAASWPA